MHTGEYGYGSDKVYYRLVTLWAICEAFAGGLMHGANIPMTGMVISGLAVTCIILISYHTSVRLGIIRATLLVCMAKLALSPHSPPTAYIAVGFQGLMGQLLLTGKRFFTVKAVLLGILSLVESAVQRILVLLIIFGKSFWQAFDQYIQKLTGDTKSNSYAIKIAVAYIILHAIAGCLVGYFATRVAQKARQWKSEHPEWIFPVQHRSDENPVVQKKRLRTGKIILMAAWVLLLVSWLRPDTGFLPKGEALEILIRSILIVGGWLLFVAPWIMKLFRLLLKKKENQYSKDLQMVMNMIPVTRKIFTKCWQESGICKGWARVSRLIQLLSVNLL